MNKPSAQKFKLESLNVKLIKESFEALKPFANDFATEFYKNLFKDFPQIETYFVNTDLDMQKNKLIQSLVFCIENLESQNKLVPFLRSLGKRHHSYGVEDIDYNSVGASLVKTLKAFFGENWTLEAELQWSQVYDLISEQMKMGAQEVGEDTESLLNSKKPFKEVPLDEYVRRQALKLFEQALNQQMDFQLQEMVNKKARKLIKQAINLEVQKQTQHLLKKAG